MHKTIMDGLKARECRWVFDTSPATFCCERTKPGRSYCTKHAKIVYVASQRPRRAAPTFLPVEMIAPPKDETAPLPDLVEVLTPAR